MKDIEIRTFKVWLHISLACLRSFRSSLKSHSFYVTLCVNGILVKINLGSEIKIKMWLCRQYELAFTKLHRSISLDLDFISRFDKAGLISIRMGLLLDLKVFTLQLLEIWTFVILRNIAFGVSSYNWGIVSLFEHGDWGIPEI